MDLRAASLASVGAVHEAYPVTALLVGVVSVPAQPTHAKIPSEVTTAMY